MATLDSIFDSKRNGLNSIRLALAIGVILWHSFPLTGAAISYWPIRQFSSEFCVDGFFAISGFLIPMAWIRRPDVFGFIVARGLRILPAFYVCIFVTAFVFAPIFGLLHGVSVSLGDEVSYVRSNILVRMVEYNVGATPSNVPLPLVWDGSLWTLFYELLCYGGVLLLGVIGVWRAPRIGAACLFIFSVVIQILVINHVLNHWLFTIGARFAVMFSAGTVMFAYRKSIPAGRGAVLGAALLIVASLGFGDYRLTAALPIACFLVVGGARLKHPRWSLRSDYSYGSYIYAFPAQQFLAATSFARLPVVFFCLLSIGATAPLAAASWWAIERPALSLKSRVLRGRRQIIRDSGH